MTSHPTSELKFSARQPAWHVVLLSLFTFTAYIPFWLLKTIKVLKKNDLLESVILKKIRSAILFIWMFFPILNLPILASIFYDSIKLTPKEVPLKDKPGPLALIMALLTTCLWFLGKLDVPMFLLFNLSVLPVAQAQHWLNAYWDKVEDESFTYRQAFSIVELLVLIIGGLAFGLVVFNPMIEVAH